MGPRASGLCPPDALCGRKKKIHTDRKREDTEAMKVRQRMNKTDRKSKRQKGKKKEKYIFNRKWKFDVG
jgi:hypothetical protein